MKTIRSLLLLLASSWITHAFATDAIQLQTGIYNTTHGEVHLIKSRSGKKAVGLYQKRGHMLLNSFSISDRGTILAGDFSNGTSTGKLALENHTSQSWKGDWQWDTTPGVRNWDGDWDGTLRTTTKPGGMEMWKTYRTSLGDMDLIQNAAGKVGGFLYYNGKEYYVYGVFGGYNSLEFNARIASSEDELETSGEFDIRMSWDRGLYGRITVNGITYLNQRGAEVKSPLKITLQSITNYENRGIGQGELGKIKIDMALHDEKGHQFSHNLYEDTNNRNYVQGDNYPVNTIIPVDLLHAYQPVGYYSNTMLNLSFIHDRARTLSNARDRLVKEAVPMKPIMQYLTYQLSAAQFANASDGRKVVPGTSHTFWLSESNGSRKVRGYAFIKYGDNDKWAYFYTIELN
ncbi:hypothetical protein [Nonlabens xiamenensis]|uniref:hypothetical protein n=1 Tax=Nonlabens xiamenensis TaxID=2341043 RepID=UPI000F60DFCF|nr:hypothetical protein [Nonlabens xiamenensis]